MGIYVFSREFLKERLAADAERPALGARLRQEHHSRARSPTGRVFAYPFEDVKTAAQALLARRRHRGCVLRGEHGARLRHARAESLRRGLADLDLPGAGALGEVRARRGRAARRGHQFAGLGWLHHLRRHGARVAAVLQFATSTSAPRSTARCCCPHVRIGRNCRISKAILDEGCVVPDGTHIGEDLAADAERFHVTERGVVLVTPDMLAAPGAATRPRRPQDAQRPGVAAEAVAAMTTPLDRRRAGVLLHPTSLPGPFAGGVLGDDARRFVDFLADGGVHALADAAARSGRPEPVALPGEVRRTPATPASSIPPSSWHAAGSRRRHRCRPCHAPADAPTRSFARSRAPANARPSTTSCSSTAAGCCPTRSSSITGAASATSPGGNGRTRSATATRPR